MSRPETSETQREFRERGRVTADHLLSANKVRAWHVLNDASSVGESKLFALVDAVALVLAHRGPGGSLETARLVFETVVPPAVALQAVRALLGDEWAV